MKCEGHLDSSKRGVWSLTDKGKTTKLNVEQAGEIFYKWVKIFAEERKNKNKGKIKEEILLPDETTETCTNYRDQLLQLLLSLPPSGFERLCQRLLRESGFVKVSVTGRSGDGGIDGAGTLQVNPLVSFKVLFQCKRYIKSVSSPQVRDFRGAMQGRADKGIIITTGTFTADARAEASREGVPHIELVDGQKLIDMFSELQFGLIPVTTYDIDHEFFKTFESDV